MSGFRLTQLAAAINRAYPVVAVIFLGQSNIQGAAVKWCGPRIPAQNEKHVSLVDGFTDPLPDDNNVNKGGGPAPYLVDKLWDRRIRALPFDFAIGGASAFQFTGRAGVSIVGSPTQPRSVGYFSGGEYPYAGTPAVLVEGDAGFDPFGLLAPVRACIQRLAGRVDAILIIWSQGEADAGKTAPEYQAAITSIDRYLMASVPASMLTTGAFAIFNGMTVKTGSGVLSAFQTLDAGRAAAVRALAAEGLPVYDGANYLTRWLDTAPLYPEDNGGQRVHLTLRGQDIATDLWDAVLQANGY